VSAIAEPPAGADAAEHREAQAGAPRRVLRIPRACVACAAIAAAHAALWAVLTPTFQTPDEPVQISHAQYIAEFGAIPTSSPTRHAGASPALSAALQGVPWSVLGRPSWSAAESQALNRRLDRRSGRVADGVRPWATVYPPLYYTLEAGVYRLGFWGNLLDRILLMRLFSALLAGLTVAFTYLFLRELMPRAPWAWAVGALGVAFQPVFAFMGGGVNNDNLMYAAGAGLLFLLARAFRDGLSVGLGVALGATMSVALLTKGSAYGLVPGYLLGVALLSWPLLRARPGQAVLVAFLAGGLPIVAYAAWLVVNHSVAGATDATATGGLAGPAVDRATSVGGQLSYLWQFFLPRLPSQTDWFPTYPDLPLWDVYVKGFIGRFGWWQYQFSDRVNDAVLGVYLVILTLVGASVWRFRVPIRRRLPEAVTYVAVFAGIVVVVGVAGYRFRAVIGGNFEQTRYLFPALALYGAILAIAARGAGHRWGRPVGLLLVVLAVGQALAAMLLTFGRYYA